MIAVIGRVIVGVIVVIGRVVVGVIAVIGRVIVGVIIVVIIVRIRGCIRVRRITIVRRLTVRGITVEIAVIHTIILSVKLDNGSLSIFTISSFGEIVNQELFNLFKSEMGILLLFTAYGQNSSDDCLFFVRASGKAQRLYRKDFSGRHKMIHKMIFVDFRLFLDFIRKKGYNLYWINSVMLKKIKEMW